jgi:DNA-directed RNA polymerase specialized sigma24 family protein
MPAQTDVFLTSDDNFNEDAFWAVLYPLLFTRVRGWVHDTYIPGWKRQKQDIVADVVQTALLKIFEELKQGKKYIHSIRARSIVIAYHCYIDLVRRDSRRLILSYDDPEAEDQQYVLQNLLVDSTQEIEEKIYEEGVLAAAVKTIAEFSKKLRLEVLVDLANHSCFDEEPTALQRAFLAVGIRLQDYQRAPSPDPAERGRQSALRSLGYKRVSQADVI